MNRREVLGLILGAPLALLGLRARGARAKQSLPPLMMDTLLRDWHHYSFPGPA